MRHNHPAHKVRTLDLYDVVYIDLPEHGDVSRLIVPPLKTIYVNLAADTDGHDRLFRDVWAFADYIGDERFLLM